MNDYVEFRPRCFICFKPMNLELCLDNNLSSRLECSFLCCDCCVTADCNVKYNISSFGLFVSKEPSSLSYDLSEYKANKTNITFIPITKKRILSHITYVW